MSDICPMLTDLLSAPSVRRMKLRERVADLGAAPLSSAEDIGRFVGETGAAIVAVKRGIADHVISSAEARVLATKLDAARERLRALIEEHTDGDDA